MNKTAVRVTFRAGAAGIVLIMPMVSGYKFALSYNNYDTPACKLPYGGGGSYLTVYWQDHPSYPPSGFYSSAFINGRSAWNGAPTPVWFTNGGGPTLGLGALPPGNPGVVSYSCVGQTFVASALWVDSGQLSSYPDAIKQKVVSHELGHTVALGHSYNYAVLKTGATNVPSYPTTDDECAVNTRYISFSWPAAWYCFI